MATKKKMNLLIKGLSQSLKNQILTTSKFMRAFFLSKPIYLFLGINLFFFIAKGQVLNFKVIDSVVVNIDSDTSLVVNNVTLDTICFIEKGQRLKLQDFFTVYRKGGSKKIVKITWNRYDGEYYDLFTLYYKNGKAIKGIVKAKFRRTDTNPALETITIFYVKSGRVIYNRKYGKEEFYANGHVYLSTISYYLKIADIKLK
jgi:hypothetical protein